jgi:hypothetical protein
MLGVGAADNKFSSFDQGALGFGAHGFEKFMMVFT